VLNERVKELLGSSVKGLLQEGLTVSNITGALCKETQSHVSTKYKLLVSSNGQEYPIRVDYIRDNSKGDTLTVWHMIGNYSFLELSLPQSYRLQNWWKLNHPESNLKLARAINGDLIFGTSKPLQEFDESSLVGTITSLIDSVPEIKNQIQKNFN
jgi:hypothetical protein